MRDTAGGRGSHSEKSKDEIPAGGIYYHRNQLSVSERAKTTGTKKPQAPQNGD
jgi:hypothetical protein